ncbi:MAG: ATP-binding protein, partial [Desulfurococcales archaeon]|nr:ATP-binding protein [Desulfurococcales archaeon]
VKIGVTGGKGGTGKSTVATNLAAVLASERKVVLGDLDVEDPVDHILLGVELQGEEPVKIMLPVIDYSKCTSCGVCVKICDTGALIASKDGRPFVLPRLCSGCRSCYFACPEKAIIEGGRILGYTYRTDVALQDGLTFQLVTGMLREGEEHTSPVVIAARERATSVAEDVLLVDTSAGTGNNISIALEGAKLAIAVTEPTPLGLHDLESILELTSIMGIETWVVENRAGIGSDEKVVDVARKFGVEVKAKIPYSKELIKHYVQGVPIVLGASDSEPARVLRSLGRELLEVM